MLEDPGNLATLQTNSELGSKHALAAAAVQNEDDLFAFFQKSILFGMHRLPLPLHQGPQNGNRFRVGIHRLPLLRLRLHSLSHAAYICFNVADVFFSNNIGFAKIVLMQGFP